MTFINFANVRDKDYRNYQYTLILLSIDIRMLHLTFKGWNLEGLFKSNRSVYALVYTSVEKYHCFILSIT